MATRVGINGFGRIGRQVTKAIFERTPGLELVAINDLADAKANAMLFNRDSVHGKWPGTVSAEGDTMIVDGKRIKVFAEKDPAKLDWKSVGAQVVVDVANAPDWEDHAVITFFETSGRNLLAAEAAAGVGHHVALSVVGTDRLLASGYFRAKLAQEKLIKASPIPYTIVRATQFYEFVGGIAQLATEGQTVRVPPVLMQPIAAEDVAVVLADVAVSSPLNGTLELAGPEPIRQDDLVRQFLKATGDARTVIPDPQALYYGLQVNDQSLTPGANPRLGTIRFADWLKQHQ
mgnify:CR=1 FL=1